MTATVTNLKTQVQAKIDAATGATSLEDLLILRKAAEGLGCNETNLDTLVTAALNAMGGSTPLDDLLMGNMASDLVGAGGGPSNYLAPGNVSDAYLRFAVYRPSLIITGINITNMAQMLSIDVPVGKKIIVKHLEISNLETYSNFIPFELEVDGSVRLSRPDAAPNSSSSAVTIIGFTSINDLTSTTVTDIEVRNNIKLRAKKIAGGSNATVSITYILVEA